MALYCCTVTAHIVYKCAIVNRIDWKLIILRASDITRTDNNAPIFLLLSHLHSLHLHLSPFLPPATSPLPPSLPSLSLPTYLPLSYTIFLSLLPSHFLSLSLRPLTLHQWCIWGGGHSPCLAGLKLFSYVTCCTTIREHGKLMCD